MRFITVPSSKLVKTSEKGFTLIELLVVIAIIAALAVAVFVALNPAKRLSDSRESKRATDVETILTAIHEATVDNKGTLPTGMSTSMAITQLGTGATGCNLVAANVPAGWGGSCVIAATACLNLMNSGNAVNLTKYLASMPIDPKGATSGTTPVTLSATNTGYAVTVDANNIVTVTACGGEGAAPVSTSR